MAHIDHFESILNENHAGPGYVSVLCFHFNAETLIFMKHQGVMQNRLMVMSFQEVSCTMPAQKHKRLGYKK